MAAHALALTCANAEPVVRTPTSLAESDDATLARAMIERHEVAARVALTRFSPMVRRILRRAMGRERDVEDVVQDIFLCLFDRVGTLRDPQALRAFVIAITLRVARYHIRRHKTRRFVMLSRTPELDDARFRQAECASQHALSKFQDILEKLSERDRVAFILRFVEGLEAAEIAESLGVSVPTARRRFVRAWERVTLFAERDLFLKDYLA